MEQLELPLEVDGRVMINNPISPNHYELWNGEKQVLDLIADRCIAMDRSGYGSSYRGRLYGDVIKYTMRWMSKNGVEDLKKARQYLDWLIEDLE